MPTLHCASGLVIEARRYKLQDRKALFDKNAAKRGLTQVKMLETVTTSVVEAGPYMLSPDQKLNWLEVAYSDIATALVRWRTALKKDYDFDANCPVCNDLLQLSADLSATIYKPMSEAGRQHLSAGAPLVLTIFNPDVEKASREFRIADLQIRLLLGKDLTSIANAVRESGGGFEVTMAVQAMLSIVSIALPDGRKLQDPIAIRDYYDNAEWFFHKQLLEFIDETSGGTDTDVRQTCRSCRKEIKLPLPLDIGFYDPSMEPSRRSTVAG